MKWSCLRINENPLSPLPPTNCFTVPREDNIVDIQISDSSLQPGECAWLTKRFKAQVPFLVQMSTFESFKPDLLIWSKLDELVSPEGLVV